MRRRVFFQRLTAVNSPYFSASFSSILCFQAVGSGSWTDGWRARAHADQPRTSKGAALPCTAQSLKKRPQVVSSCLVTRSVEPEQSPVLTLVDTAEQICGMPDPLIQALVDKLPKPNTV